MGNLEIIYLDRDDLKPYENNSRTHTPEQIQQLERSIIKFGFTNPILIDENRVVIAGHARLEASNKLNLDQVPCIVLNGLTDAEKRAYVIADNKLALNADWDLDLLKREVEHLKQLDFEIEVLGFSPDELKKLTGDDEEDEDENPYTQTVKTPLYTPDGSMPELSELYTTTKADDLIQKLSEVSNLNPDVIAFLTAAARRHTRFNYEKIANYYAHAPKEVQVLMEDMALVIIDYEKAIESGYMDFSVEVDKLYDEEH